MARDLVFEIGTEEIPARFMAGALEQMTSLAKQYFGEYRLTYQKISTYGTPRRLVLYVSDLSINQGELVEEVKGPPVKAAYTEDGKPTKAAEGFARSQGVSVDELEIRDFKGGEYVFALKREAGKPTFSILPDVLLDIVNGINFPKPMRWGNLEMRFARPIRWILALFGDQVVPVELAGLIGSNMTYGHRFLSPGPHHVTDASQYFKVLEQSYVLVDQKRRKKIIWEQVTTLAASVEGKVEEDPELLEEITYLVEYPTALIGSFSSEFLKMPKEVVITPMRDHQRYFPVWNSQGELLPLFIAVNNGTETYHDNIRRGNEKVLAARLTDAAFFYREDQKTTLESKVDKLEEIIFQESLGTMLAKTRRLKRLACTIAGILDLPGKLSPVIERTARLAKADLVTSMVYEFPELQGIMGSYYALNDGESEEVSKGILQHYWPRFAGDSLPDSIPGMVVGIADRLDTLVGCFGAGLIPTGSQDPYALRRQATGLVAMTVEFNLKFSLAEVINAAYEGYNVENIKLPQPLETVLEQLSQFCCQRLEHILEEKGLRFDVIQAVLAAGNDDLASAYQRARDLETFRKEEGFVSLQTAFTRAFNLSRQAKEERYVVKVEMLQKEVEKELYQVLERVKEKVIPLIDADNYLEALKTMTALQKPIDNFFDSVLVMVPETEIRNNRLALLQEVVALVFKIADLSRLVP